MKSLPTSKDFFLVPKLRTLTVLQSFELWWWEVSSLKFLIDDRLKFGSQALLRQFFQTSKYPYFHSAYQLGVFLECKTFMHSPYSRPTTATLGQNIAQKTPHSKLFWLQYISWLSAVSTLHTDHKGFNTIHKLNPVITF